MNETISVVIPYYKNWGTIEETVKSIKSQSLQPTEVVIVDDNSLTDISLYRIPGVKVYSNSVNLGCGGNLNECVKKSIGDIIVFMSANDIMLPNALQNIYTAFKTYSGIAAVTRPYYFFYKDWHKPIRYTKLNKFRFGDAVALCGQMSGIGVRRKYLSEPFINKTFVEFVSGIIPIFRKQKILILATPTVAIRYKNAGSCNKNVYKQSPTKNWIEVCGERKDIARFVCGKNYVGLIQVKAYAGTLKLLRECWYMIRLYPLNLLSSKFWIYLLLLLIIPASLIKFMVIMWWRLKCKFQK